MDWPLDCRTGQKCPKCGQEIVYNGNYFCSGYIISGLDSAFGDDEEATCDWAMSEEESDGGELFRRCLDGLMANRAKAKR
jgi:hypothetical protein